MTPMSAPSPPLRSPLSLGILIGAGLGLTLALVLMASIRETSELSDIPAIAKGTGLTLIIAGSLSLAFMGFAGMKF